MDEATPSMKPGKSDDLGHLVTMAEVTVRATELAYVTAISLEHKTFFVQQCKYTNESLMTHNKLIHEYCERLCKGAKNSPENRPVGIQVGDVFCTRYAVDANWYRGMIKSCDDQKRMCQLYFVDYGNYETVPYDELLQVSPQDLPTIEKAPFGFHCTLKGSEEMGPADSKTLLECIFEEYILFKPKERLDVDHWCVEVPKVAYNTTFWVSYETAKARQSRKFPGSGEEQQVAKIDCA